jgi:hypothetical protein
MRFLRQLLAPSCSRSALRLVAHGSRSALGCRVFRSGARTRPLHLTAMENSHYEMWLAGNWKNAVTYGVHEVELQIPSLVFSVHVSYRALIHQPTDSLQTKFLCHSSKMRFSLASVLPAFLLLLSFVSAQNVTNPLGSLGSTPNERRELNQAQTMRILRAASARAETIG